MSSIRTSPPQTYSRLFRPWDGKSAQPEQPECVKSESDNELDISDRMHEDLDQQHHSHQQSASQMAKDQFYASAAAAAAAMNMDPSLFAANMSFCAEMSGASNPALSGAYPMYPTGVATVPDMDYLPFMNMVDPITRGLMEQEYVRVMTEEAQNKLINMRKQRPKKFKCPHCDVAFSNNGQLKGHIRIHTGERPFKCEDKTCGKTFTRNEELTRHKRIHTGLRPFACSVCGKKFGRRDHLKKHTKIHFAPERLFQSATTVFLPYPPPASYMSAY